MNRPAIKWFCYERNFAGEWKPVFYAEPPNDGVDFKPARTTPHLVPEDFNLKQAMELWPFDIPHIASKEK